MIKNSFVSVISQKEKEENWGSAEFQVFCFTNKIRRTYFLFGIAQIDYLSQRGLRKILGKRQRLLAYLSKKKLSTLQRINWSVEYSRDNNSLI